MPTHLERTLGTIPLEIRQMIFKQLFQSITVRRGFGKTSLTNTSILQTCHQFHTEAKNHVVGNISLHFGGTAAMLDYLTVLTAEHIKQIRQIRLKGFPVPLYTDPEMFSYTTYGMASIIPMFPGLQLDRLIIEDCYHGEGVNDGWGDCGTYFDIESLVRSKGWKELHFITPTTEFMSSPNDQHQQRVAQPAGWDMAIKKIDGETSGAEVKMYVAKEPNVAGMAENPQTRVEYSAVPGHLANPNAVNYGPGYTMMAPQKNSDHREALVVVRRGAGASYIEDGNGLHAEIKSLLEHTTWLELRESDRYVDPEDDPCAHL
jgi:hypothetical protein